MPLRIISCFILIFNGQIYSWWQHSVPWCSFYHPLKFSEKIVDELVRGWKGLLNMWSNGCSTWSEQCDTVEMSWGENVYKMKSNVVLKESKNADKCNIRMYKKAYINIWAIQCSFSSIHSWALLDESHSF